LQSFVLNRLTTSSNDSVTTSEPALAFSLLDAQQQRHQD
jgi:hypothetical protein